MDFKEKLLQTKDKVLPILTKGKDKADSVFDTAEEFIVQRVFRRKEKDIDSLLDTLADNLIARFKRWRNGT